jgi:tetratricopeptide (TPR) repeat protein
MRTSFKIAGAVFAGAALLIGAALVPLRVGRSDASTPAAEVTEDAALLPAMTSDLDEAIAALLSQLEQRPEDAKLHAQLGLRYLQRSRNDADPSSLPRAERALRTSLNLQPQENLFAFVGMASLSNARHDFSGSVKWSRRAIETDPYSASAYGLLGDALFELGEVDAAAGAYQDMVDRRPDVASYVRASYTFQYQRRTQAAIGAMKLALEAAGPTGESAAWIRHQLGDIYAGLGEHGEVARQNRIGIALAPGYVPPTVGLAESFIARGRLGKALKIVERAADELPTLEYIGKLGDLYRAMGREAAAETQYARVARKLGDYRRNGVRPDADFIVFYADHGIRPKAALREAFSIYRNRPTAKVADALGWMLHSLGRDESAWRYAKEAAHSGDAGISFHAGMIALATEREESGVSLLREALRVNPSFSILGPSVARRALEVSTR